MSFLVTMVPAVQLPTDPGTQAWVNAPATTTSPLTTAMLYTVEGAQLPPNHWVLHCVAPANTFGVQPTALEDTRAGSEAAAGVTCPARAGPATRWARGGCAARGAALAGG